MARGLILPCRLHLGALGWRCGTGESPSLGSPHPGQSSTPCSSSSCCICTCPAALETIGAPASVFVHVPLPS
ncbi:hypothetical protein BDP81DRAFT_422622 [Colletotrichum phormii]|uniref:Uncharacterized protein n=1 Tax=Colletotrichum phormii TaxID=359342 RepID=A0AAJ0EG00_9PEZI|nr:uncharacterized protein BDP81DRAFT_422622 [Colletotrichum phormii]KAK1638767.1 hypothetical protein BDP81DRAFT_422622 [Colletotrichum phormii]